MDSIASSVRIVARTPRNIAPILDAGTAQVLKRLMHETFASFAATFAPTPGARRFSHEIAAALALYFNLLSLLREGGAVGEALYWVARKDLLLTTTNGDEERRRRRGRLALVAALVHVAGPYLDNKVAQLREDAELVLSLPPDEAGDSSSSSATANTVASRARAFLLRALVRAHPVVKLGLGLQDVWSRIRFTANLSRFATLEHWLVEMPVGRLTPAEWNAQNRLREAARARWLARARASPSAPRRWALAALLRTRFLAEDYNKVALLALAVGCKSLEWWYNSGEEAAREALKTRSNLPPPPAPTPSSHASAKKLPRSSQVCPICRQRKEDPTCLTCSGYVFCYNCIMVHVKAHGKCPVTLIRATEEHVRRLYLNS